MFKFFRRAYTGRSMIEMLGVLAVVGVLSIGGLAAYQFATNKNRANETVKDVMILRTELVTNEAFSSIEVEEGYIEVQMEAYSRTTMMGYPMEVYKRTNGEFVIDVENVPSGVCKHIMKMSDKEQLLVGTMRGEVSVKYNGTNASTLCTSENGEGTVIVVFLFSQTGESVENFCFEACGGGEACCGQECVAIPNNGCDKNNVCAHLECAKCALDNSSICCDVSNGDYAVREDMCCPTPTLAKTAKKSDGACSCPETKHLKCVLKDKTIKKPCDLSEEDENQIDVLGCACSQTGQVIVNGKCVNQTNSEVECSGVAESLICKFTNGGAQCGVYCQNNKAENCVDGSCSPSNCGDVDNYRILKGAGGDYADGIGGCIVRTGVGCSQKGKCFNGCDDEFCNQQCCKGDADGECIEGACNDADCAEQFGSTLWKYEKDSDFVYNGGRDRCGKGAAVCVYNSTGVHSCWCRGDTILRFDTATKADEICNGTVVGEGDEKTCADNGNTWNSGKGCCCPPGFSVNASGDCFFGATTFDCSKEQDSCISGLTPNGSDKCCVDSTGNCCDIDNIACQVCLAADPRATYNGACCSSSAEIKAGWGSFPFDFLLSYNNESKPFCCRENNKCSDAVHVCLKKEDTCYDCPNGRCIENCPGTIGVENGYPICITSDDKMKCRRMGVRAENDYICTINGVECGKGCNIKGEECSLGTCHLQACASGWDFNRDGYTVLCTKGNIVCKTSSSDEEYSCKIGVIDCGNKCNPSGEYPNCKSAERTQCGDGTCLIDKINDQSCFCENKDAKTDKKWCCNKIDGSSGYEASEIMCPKGGCPEGTKYQNFVYPEDPVCTDNNINCETQDDSGFSLPDDDDLIDAGYFCKDGNLDTRGCLSVDGYCFGDDEECHKCEESCKGYCKNCE